MSHVSWLVVLVCAAALLAAGCSTHPRVRREVERVTRPPAAGQPPAGGDGPVLALGKIEARAGEQRSISAVLTTGDTPIAGTQNDIVFEPSQLRIAARENGTPDCTANRRLGKEATAFNFLPKGCDARAGKCSRVRALVLSLGNVEPIPNGSTLYTCNVLVASTLSPGAYPMRIMGLAFSTPDGRGVAGRSVDGVVSVK